MAFPTLTEGGASITPNFPINEGYENSTIKSKFEAGYQLTRARFTRDRKIFKLSYNLLSQANYVLLKAHLESVRDITSFEWTHPVTSTAYTVRYQNIFDFQYAQYNRWNCSFILEQV